ncbi:MAG: Cellulose synthase operon protein C [Herbaspirillum frisingense]|uniref:Cellulose synthase operon protein C n=1 Tax=Herbaspirillum frisingense TaxID=92645 RepID=A0A7V8JVE0_9BURK|nr:MAG: Cellulose synthase operon protein C [Herbaspirillum frisingense]
MRARSATLAVGIITALIGSTAHAEGADVQAQLVEQGQYWQARGNAQRAGEVWQKVLLLDKSQVNALYGMGLIGVKQNKPQQANEYLARLQALSPVPWQARQLMQDIALAKPENQALLDEARRLADAGERDKATDAFRKMFNGLTPEGTIGREYYNNLAFNDAGWPEARKGMERLLRETPDDSILALFYGKQLARHEDSRAEGARVLARLTKHVDIAGDADESWRLALVWMGPPTAAQAPLFEEFLKAHPDDQQIREQLNKGRQKAVVAQPQDTVLGRGLLALQKGDLAEAEKAFQERLSSHPDDIDAMGGLGVIRQQQNRFADAEQLLGRAVAKGGSQWKTALDSVRYWLLIQRGRELQAKGQAAQAQGMFAQALRLDPKNIDGRLAIADIQAEAGQFDTAVAAYRQVLSMQPGNPPAVRGLVSVLSQTGHADEALRLLDSLSPAEQAKFGDQKRLRSLRAAQMANLAEQRGDMAGAQNAMHEAVRNDPDNVWTAFSLARLYLKSGEQQKARDTINVFSRTHPDNIDAPYAGALLAVEMEQWADAQSAINRIAPNRRSAAMNELADQITLTVQVNQALTLAKSGQRQDALVLLDRLQPLVEGNAERIGTLASAYVDAGDTQRALAMMQPLVGPGSAPPANLLLQYASILLRTGDDAQVYSILSALQNQPLSAATRKRYDDLRFQYRVRQADRLREGGDLASAYDTLAPALMQRPGDVSAISALARMYIANGDSARALDLYRPLVQRNPQDAGVLLSAADAAVAARDNAFAEAALGQFVKLQSTDPTSLTEAARIYRTIGKVGEATALLRQAVAIEASQKQRAFASQSGTMNLAVNPFRNQRRQAVLDAASALPPPAETVLNRSAVANAGAGDVLPAPADTLRRVPAVASAYPGGAPAYAKAAPVYPAAAPGYPNYPAYPAYPAPSAGYAANQPAGRAQGASAAQRELLALQADPQAALAAADGASPAQRALDDILQSRSAYVTQGVIVRGNASEGGLSQLNDVEAPLEVNMPMGDNRVAVRITPVSLNAGGMTDEAASRFGGGGSAGAAGVGSQRANGVGVGAAFERPDGSLKADIGTTPMGFKYADAVGGVSIEQPLNGSANARYGLSLSRRAVTDSLTSFAGATDRRDDRSWGGVTANGGRVQLSYDDALAGVYSYGSVHALMGHNVASNTRVELGAGAYRYLDNSADNKLTAGVSATVLSYANNQNFYTYGNGGYFSPQAYVALGVPVTWAQRADNFSFQVKGSMGIQYFQQDSADYFPTDSNLQAASGLRYAKQSKTGIGYSLEGAGEYRFGPRLFVGGALRLNNSNDFREVNVGMYVRYTFEDMKGRFMTLPLSPYRSPYSN